jgi:Mg2+-importing ATPase
MEVLSFSAKAQKDVLRELDVAEKRGLSSSEASARVAKYGANALEKKEFRWYRIFIRQFKSAFIYLLIGAGILAFLLGEATDSLMIFIFLAINVLLGFFQEYRSEKTIELLKKFVSSKVKTLRDGKIVLIKSEALALGDIIFLETGDKIPADVRFLTTDNFTVDESVITGESVSVMKNETVLSQTVTDFFGADNLGFSGTVVVNGSAKAVIVATGRKTAMGNISHLASVPKTASSFEKGINDFSGFILKLIAVTLVTIFFANVVLRSGTFSISELLLFSIALTVGVIPEALPLVTTFALSYSARILANKKVIVKRLSAVEDLGGVEIFCADKTGTLTENKLKVAEVWGENRSDVIFYANLALSDIKKKKTEPFDIALSGALNEEQRKQIGGYKRIYEESFNPETKKNVVAFEYDGSREIVFRGAPESILEYCGNISRRQRLEIGYWISGEGLDGHRVLAVASKRISSEVVDVEAEVGKAGKDFVLHGIVSFVDPIKKSTISAIESAQKLGVKIKIITGDGPEVAGAVAFHIGLIDFPEDVITNYDLKKLKDSEYMEALEKHSVFARVTPEEKYRIIETLQKKYEVGFLGEGINDAPALKIASVSVVVESASDIAREAADIILLDKSLGVIVDGIKEGRTVFANTNKYIKSTLASNFGNFFAVASSSLLITFLPMLPLQILLINLLSDFPMIAICADTVDDDELKTPKKYEVKDIIIVASVLGVVSSVFDFIFFGLFYQISPEVLRTNWFIGSILTELAFIFSIRTKKAFYKAKRPSGYLLWLSVLAIIATVIIPYTHFGQSVFGFTPPSFAHLSLIFAIVIVYFFISEAVKLIYYRSMDNSK